MAANDANDDDDDDDADDDELDHIDAQVFANEVRDHEGQHKALLLGVLPLAAVVALLLGPVIAMYAAALCLLGAGVTAIRGGKSRITDLGSRHVPEIPTWSMEELERMGPGARSHHARVTGVWLVAFGILMVVAATALAAKIGF